MPADPSVVEVPAQVIGAMRQLNPDGGWDFATIGVWPDFPTWRMLRRAEDMGLVERRGTYKTERWRLTDEGIATIHTPADGGQKDG